jgi:hypothetical protein
MEITHGKKFEKPQPGNYTATVIDIVTLADQKSTYNGVETVQNKIRIVWVLGAAYPGQVVVSKEGKPFEVIAVPNAKLTTKPKKSKLYEILEQMLGQAPPLVKNDAELEALMLGRSNQVFLVANANPSNPDDPFINVAGLTPLAPGQVAPQVPAGFVRFKNRVKTVAGQNGQPVATYSTPQAAAAAQPAAPAAAPTVAPTNTVAF